MVDAAFRVVCDAGVKKKEEGLLIMAEGDAFRQ